MTDNRQNWYSRLFIVAHFFVKCDESIFILHVIMMLCSEKRLPLHLQFEELVTNNQVCYEMF